MDSLKIEWIAGKVAPMATGNARLRVDSAGELLPMRHPEPVVMLGWCNPAEQK